MNAIVAFGLCTLTDNELLDKVDAMTDKMYDDFKVPVRYIPARPNDDYDLLIGELLVRFNKEKWISVEDKLPDTTIDMLVALDTEVVTIGWYHVVEKKWFADSIGRVTHWQLKPTPPATKPKIEEYDNATTL